MIELPTIEIRPPADSAPLDRAIAELDAYDWLIFTSANGVRFFLERLDRSRPICAQLRAQICAIGPATRAAVEALHLKVDLMGKEYVAESLLEAFAAHDLAGKRILLPRAAVARDLVPDELARRGAHVDVVEAYRTVAPEASARSRSRDVLAQHARLHHVHQFLHRAQSGAKPPEPTRCAASRSPPSGPITTQTARDLGVEVAAQAEVFNVEGLVSAVLGDCTLK